MMSGEKKTFWEYTFFKKTQFDPIQSKIQI